MRYSRRNAGILRAGLLVEWLTGVEQCEQSRSVEQHHADSFDAPY